MTDNDDLEPIEGPKEKSMDIPKITEILDDPFKLVDWQYQTFLSDKTKELKQIVNDAKEAKEKWEVLSKDNAFIGLPTIEISGVLIRELTRCFWAYKLLFEKANATIEEIRNIKEQYYVLKQDALEGKEEQKEVISQIDQAEEEKGKAFVKFCEEQVKGYETDVAKQIINQQLIGNLIRYSQKFIADRFKKFNLFVEQMNVPERTREEVYVIYLDMHRAFHETYGKYPFIWLKLPEIIQLKDKVKK